MHPNTEEILHADHIFEQVGSNVTLLQGGGAMGRRIFTLLDFRLPPRHTFALAWDITQCRVIIPYRRLGTTHRFYLKGSRNPSLVP